MKYLSGSFQTGGYSKSYADNFDRIFRCCSSEFEFRGHTYHCERPKNHEESFHKAKLIDGDKPTDYVTWSGDGRESFVYETLVIK